MRAWARPNVPRVPGTGRLPRVFDSATSSVVTTRPTDAASLYVCGITPYDATHLGHAATYLAFDTLLRLWLDAGYPVTYVQNTTDVDDPLLERAERDGVDWRGLAQAQTDLFRSDMELLRIVPPDHYVAVTEVVAEVAEAVAELRGRGWAYEVGDDLYFDSAFADEAWHLGAESGLDRQTMLRLSAERGGDPQRSGKRDPLDPLLWRAALEGEPSWPTVLGDGRPGWHVECTVIALRHLPATMTVSGGGSDLIFPHHEYSAGHASALTDEPFAHAYAHAGMVAYRGEKMSKSLGNLVLVSRLNADGADPRAIRLALLAEHYRSDWEWTDAHLDDAVARLARWDAWAAGSAGGSAVGECAADGDEGTLDRLRSVLAEDLDTPAAIEAIDARIAAGTAADPTLLDAIDALLGIRLGTP